MATSIRRARLLRSADDARNDIVAAGGDVSISGNAANEVLAVGGSLVLSGRTGGDARLAGGNVTVAGAIEGEAVLAGGKVHLLPKGSDRKRSDRCGWRHHDRGGRRRQRTSLRGQGPDQRDDCRRPGYKSGPYRIGRNAKIGGNLRYEAPQEATIEQGAVIAGQKIFRQAEYERPRKRIMAFLGALWLMKLLAHPWRCHRHVSAPAGTDNGGDGTGSEQVRP